jgi:TPR repeat protein
MKKLLILLLLTLGFIGSTNADFEDGVNAYNSEDYQTAYKELLPLARNNDSSAQIYIGDMYYFGYAVSQDRTKALEWYAKAAEFENPVAPVTRIVSIFYNFYN